MMIAPGASAASTIAPASAPHSTTGIARVPDRFDAAVSADVDSFFDPSNLGIACYARKDRTSIRVTPRSTGLTAV
jgi:hypothetical protein